MKPLTQRLVTATFVMMITFPAISFVLPLEPVEIENRRVQAPRLTIGRLTEPAFYGEWIRYIRDANPARAWLIYLGTGVDFYVLGESPNPNSVLLGEDDWLYGRESIDGLCGGGSVRASVANLTELVSGLRSSGIEVVFTIAPAKFHMHPEHLTQVQTDLAECGHEAADALEAELSNGADPGYVDSPALFQAIKSAGITPYFRTDTHFNHTASIALIDAIVTELEPGIWEEDAVINRGKSSFVGNLMTLIGLREPETFEDVIVDRGMPRIPSEQLHDRFSSTQTATERYSNDVSGQASLIQGRALMLKDSFMDIPAPSLAQYFEDLTLTDWRSDDSVRYFIANAPSADIVIIEVSEESLLIRFGDDGPLNSLTTSLRRG